jgi:hypothetical protein
LRKWLNAKLNLIIKGSGAGLTRERKHHKEKAAQGFEVDGRLFLLRLDTGILALIAISFCPKQSSVHPAQKCLAEGVCANEQGG